MLSKPPIVLGVDPGSQTTGYGIITQEGSRLIHIKSGSIHAPQGAVIEKRLHFIHKQLYQIIQETTPTTMAIEGVFHAKNVRSVLALAQARGVILLTAAQMSLSVSEYSPMEIKKATVGYGRAQKDQIKEMIHRLFKFSGAPDLLLHDQSDALAIAVCHLNSYRTEQFIQYSIQNSKELSVQ